MNSTTHSVLIYGQQCSMSGRRADDSYRYDDGTVSDDVVEYKGTLAELRETAAELEAAKSIWMNRAGRVIREHCDMYPA